MSVCSNCGKELQQGALVCRNCGTRVTSSTVVDIKEDKKTRKKMKAPKENNVKETEEAKQEAKPVNKVEPNPKRTRKQKVKVEENLDLLKDDVKSESNNSSDYMSVGNFVIMLIIQMIPVLGFIMIIVWAVSKNNNINKRNYARAILIIQIALALITAIIGVSALILFS